MANEKKSFKEKLIGNEIQTLTSISAKQILRLGFSEMFGTAILVGLGCMSTKDTTNSAPTHLNVVLSFSFAIAIAVMTFGHISGAHINPALSLVAVVMQKLSLQMFVVYTFFQCLGATLGYSITRSLFPEDLLGNSFCCTIPNTKISIQQAFGAEMVLSVILAMILCAAWDARCLDKHDSLPIKFGIAIIALAVPGAQFAGCSINPARSFGPALVSNNWDKHWLYWVAPLSGAFVGSVIYKILFFEGPQEYEVVKSFDNDENVKLKVVETEEA